MKVVGYITSDHVSTGFISHHIQNNLIRNFVTNKNYKFLLSWTEYKTESSLVFRSLLCENFYEGICFFSIEQLFTSIEMLNEVEVLIKKKYWIGFAREDFFIDSENQIKKLRELYFLQKYNLLNLKMENWIERNKKFF